MASPNPSTHAALRTGLRPALEPARPHNREWGKDIASLALAAAGATKVDPATWWTMDENGAMCTPLPGLDFVVYKLKKRAARRHPNIYNQWGARLGPQATSALSQKFRAPQLTPPAARKVSTRELLTLLRNPDQAGYPAR